MTTLWSAQSGRSLVLWHDRFSNKIRNREARDQWLIFVTTMVQFEIWVSR